MNLYSGIAIAAAVVFSLWYAEHKGETIGAARVVAETAAVTAKETDRQRKAADKLESDRRKLEVETRDALDKLRTTYGQDICPDTALPLATREFMRDAHKRYAGS